MGNIFADSEKTKQRKKRLTLLAFYGPVLYLFALLISSGKVVYSPCFFNLFCVRKEASVFWIALPVYLYLLLFVLFVVYTYVGIEALVRRKNHLLFFKIILTVLPLVFSVVILMREPVLEEKHYFFMVLFFGFSLLGWLMIVFRKK